MNEKLNQDLELLIKLQEIDLELDRFQEECIIIPSEIEKQKEEVEAIRQGFEEKKKNIKEMQSKHKGLELEIAAKDEAIKKQRTDLNVVKTNEQYKAMQAQISKIEQEKGQIEEDILKSMEEIDVFNKNVKDEESKMKTEEGRVNDKIKILEDKKKEFENKFIGLEQERKTIATTVSPVSLKKYEHIRSKGKDGLAITSIENENCGSCHIKLTAQIINEVAKNQSLIICDNCSRILYIPKI